MNTPRLKSNLDSIRDRIASAARRSGRQPADVQLVAVSKYVDAEQTEQLVQAGATVLGESRPQALWNKAAQMQDLSIEWHLIGHLQRNKVARTLPLVSLIHSVDSVRLAQAIDESAASIQQTTNVLVEVNTSGEAAKQGFPIDQVEAILNQSRRWENVHVRGLMTMAANVHDDQHIRHSFAALRNLRDECQRNTDIPLPELSMGMSRDFELAIEEGATLVRVGSSLWEGV